MIKHKTLAFFIPHRGCPHQCSFCEQHVISGTESAPTVEAVHAACVEMLARYAPLMSAEIGFFGGSFTAIDAAYQSALLEAVQPFLGEGKFEGIRISTRPDAIDDTVLARMKAYHVTAIELGAQSMSEKVLLKNERGHTAQAVREASAKIRDNGFSLGLQQMVGLYGSTLAEEYDTLEQLLACKPETLRIYPTVVLKGTKLAEFYQRGEYPQLSEEAVLEYCADALCRCYVQGVRVIRMGLHDTPSLRENRIGGYYHPAYRELVESRLYRRALARVARDCGEVQLFVETAPRTLSQLLGQRGCNRAWFAQRGIVLQAKESPDVSMGKIRWGKRYYSVWQTEERDAVLP